MQGTNQLVRSNWGLGVLLRDTSTRPGWDRTGNPPTARRQLYLLSHIAPYGIATAPRVGSTFVMLAGAMVRVGCDASHPNSSAVLAALVVLGGVSGPSSEAALEQSAHGEPLGGWPGFPTVPFGKWSGGIDPEGVCGGYRHELVDGLAVGAQSLDGCFLRGTHQGVGLPHHGSFGTLTEPPYEAWGWSSCR